MSEPSKSYKRFGSMVDTGSGIAKTAQDTGEALYKRVRTFTASMPAVDKAVGAVEERAVELASPLVSKALDVGDKALHFADSKASANGAAARPGG
jgi:hypothetical protein